MEFCPDELQTIQEVISQLSCGKAVDSVPIKFRAKNGYPVYFLIDSNVCWDETGAFKHTRCFVRNDAERRIQETINNENIKKTILMSSAKDRFIRKVFHEIKTPLHILSSSLQSESLFQNAEELKTLCNQVFNYSLLSFFI
jgi:signal transduction histidine kinase